VLMECWGCYIVGLMELLGGCVRLLHYFND
jgi:hypothetical protein